MELLIIFLFIVILVGAITVYNFYKKNQDLNSENERLKTAIDTSTSQAILHDVSSQAEVLKSQDSDKDLVDNSSQTDTTTIQTTHESDQSLQNAQEIERLNRKIKQ